MALKKFVPLKILSIPSVACTYADERISAALDSLSSSSVAGFAFIGPSKIGRGGGKTACVSS